jgi:hypothetical protein
VARCGHGHSLGGHDGDVESLGDLRCRKKWREAFLFNEKYRTEIAARSLGFHRRLAEARIDDGGIIELCEVVANIQSADAESFPAVRFGEVSARIVDDVPVDIVLL